MRTFTKSELTAMLAAAGFKDIYFYYPFPDYKLPTVIYSDDNIRDADIDFPENANYDLSVMTLFSQNKAFAGLKGTEERAALANSFLIEAVCGEEV